MKVVYPNQKIVTIHKAATDEKNIYMRLNIQALFDASKGFSEAELKVFLYLAGNQDNYQMALSTEDIHTQMGISVGAAQAAVRKLVEKGYLVQNHKSYYDFYETPCEPHVTKGSAKNNDCKTTKSNTSKQQSVSLYPEEKHVEIKHTKNEKKVNNSNTSLLIDDAEEWKKITNRIKVNFLPHTIKALSQAAGTEVSPRVINRIISHNANAFDHGMDETEGYRFKTLLNLVGQWYEKTACVIAGEDWEYKMAIEEWRNKPRIDYSRFNYTPKEEGLGDISALLDEIFS